MSRRRYEQEPPFAVQVEFSEGCNLYCNFCGLQGIRTQKEKNFKFATARTIKRIASQMAELGWTARVEFAMHGEPTMHPDYIGMVGIFRQHLPQNQLMMTTNGGGLLRPPGPLANVEGLFSAGINVIAFDAYEYVKIEAKVMGELEGRPDTSSFQVRYYPEDLEASPHRRWPRSTKLFVRMKDITVAKEGSHSTLNNHCGAGSASNDRGHGKRCAKPFRELSFRWNGAVAVCCNDWRGVYKIGSIHDVTLDELWQHERFMAARKFLLRGERSALSPCDVCDAMSYRVGLLPDKMGRETMPRITDRDREVIEEATSGRVYTRAVRRPWEG
jgi:hypothetical protein